MENDIYKVLFKCDNEWYLYDCTSNPKITISSISPKDIDTAYILFYTEDKGSVDSIPEEDHYGKKLAKRTYRNIKQILKTSIDASRINNVFRNSYFVDYISDESKKQCYHKDKTGKTYDKVKQDVQEQTKFDIKDEKEYCLDTAKLTDDTKTPVKGNIDKLMGTVFIRFDNKYEDLFKLLHIFKFQTNKVLQYGTIGIATTDIFKRYRKLLGMMFGYIKSNQEINKTYTDNISPTIHALLFLIHNPRRAVIQLNNERKAWWYKNEISAANIQAKITELATATPSAGLTTSTTTRLPDPTLSSASSTQPTADPNANVTSRSADSTLVTTEENETEEQSDEENKTEEQSDDENETEEKQSEEDNATEETRSQNENLALQSAQRREQTEKIKQKRKEKEAAKKTKKQSGKGGNKAVRKTKRKGAKTTATLEQKSSGDSDEEDQTGGGIGTIMEHKVLRTLKQYFDVYPSSVYKSYVTFMEKEARTVLIDALNKDLKSVPPTELSQKDTVTNEDIQTLISKIVTKQTFTTIDTKNKNNVLSNLDILFSDRHTKMVNSCFDGINQKLANKTLTVDEVAKFFNILTSTLINAKVNNATTQANANGSVSATTQANTNGSVSATTDIGGGSTAMLLYIIGLLPLTLRMSSVVYLVYLVISVMGQNLFVKEDYQKWENALNELIVELEQNKQNAKSTLGASSSSALASSFLFF